jgi:hypothetical protein
VLKAAGSEGVVGSVGVVGAVRFLSSVGVVGAVGFLSSVGVVVGRWDSSRGRPKGQEVGAYASEVRSQLEEAKGHNLSLSFGKPLGYGRNGCVFRADWQGKHVAVKQFDLGRPEVYAMFMNEISAYEKLEHAQGILIPRALFLTQSKFGIAYLGLQLGRMPEVGDDVSNWGQIIRRLRTEYGFCHGDADGRNGIFIEDNQGGEILVAIDLEEYRLLDNRKI